MPKRYVLKQLDSRADAIHGGGDRPLERNLLNLAALGIKWNTNMIKQIRTDADYNQGTSDQLGEVNPNMMTGDDMFIRAHNNISGQNDYIAYYDQTYLMRRDFLRKFALQGEINYVVETIADETIVNDESHYFAYPDTKKLRTILKKENGHQIIEGINEAYKHVYHMFHFNESNDAWQYCKKFLIDGFLAFEIIYSDTPDGKNASDIIGFKELDPTTLQPEIRLSPDGKEYKVWIISKGDKEKERVLLDTHVIYISWAKSNFTSHLSYCERLIHSFNTLRTLENSRIIWNVQNAQKRMKFVIPVGSESEQRYMTRLRQLEAYYKEDIVMDDRSGLVMVNGQPKFSFAKNFFFASKEGTTTEVSELGVEGHDLNSTEALKWFWQRFFLETQLPKDRFNMFFDGGETSAIMDNQTMTKEEYRYKLFIGRVRDIYQELIIKPTWLQFCLKNPKFASNDVIKNAVGLSFVEENIFTLAKEAANLKVGADIIQTLSSLQGPDQKPVFSYRYLTQRYLDFTDDDWAENAKMLEEDEAKAKENAEENGEGGNAGGNGGGFDFGGGGDLGGGFDFGGGSGSSEPAAPETPAPEPAAPEAPAPEA